MSNNILQLSCAFRRGLYSAASSARVIEAIRLNLKEEEMKKLESFEFGKELQRDTRIILEASKAACVDVPDHVLDKIKTIKDLIRFLCAKRKPPIAKGIPKFELLAGEEMPPNVTLINYRKRKWDNNHSREFIRSTLRTAHLL